MFSGIEKEKSFEQTTAATGYIESNWRTKTAARKESCRVAVPDSRERSRVCVRVSATPHMGRVYQPRGFRASRKRVFAVLCWNTFETALRSVASGK